MKRVSILLALLLQQFFLYGGNTSSQQYNIPLHALGQLKPTPQNYKLVMTCFSMVHPIIAQVFIKQANAGIAITEEKAQAILKEWNLIESNGFISTYWAHAKALLEHEESNNSGAISFEDRLLCMEFPAREEVCKLLKVNYITPSAQNLLLILRLMPLIPLDGIFASFAILELKDMIENRGIKLAPLQKNILISWGLLTKNGVLNSYWMQAFKEFDWDILLQ